MSLDNRPDYCYLGLKFWSIHSKIGKEKIMKQFKVFLREDEIPKQWYNIQADLPSPLQPPLHPGTKQPAGPQDFAPRK